MRLLLVELRRGIVRRSTRVLVLLALLLIVVLGIGMFLGHSADFSPDEEALGWRAEQVQECIRSDAYGTQLDGSDVEAICESMVPIESFVSDPRFHLTDLWVPVDDQGNGGDGVLFVSCLFLVLGALMAGATFVGADWRYGTIGTLLTWEPRRWRVFLAKAAAVTVWALIIGVVLQALVGASVLPAALWRGTTEGADAEWFGQVVGAVLRTSTLGAGAALIGYAIASIGRNSAAALGVAFGYVAIGESLVRALRPAWQPWLIGDNATVFIYGRQLPSAAFERTPGQAALILGGYMLVVLVAAGAVFARRDVA
jgi:hypothetical protein